MAVADEKLQQVIDDIDAVSSGSEMKTVLYESFRELQSCEFRAKSLGGYDTSEFVTGDMVEKIYYGKTSNSSQIFDSIPKVNSKKAVRASGIEYSIGNFKELWSNYDNIFYGPSSSSSDTPSDDSEEAEDE